MTFGILASSGPLAVVSYADAVLADSPIAYYRLHDPTSTTDLSVMTDSSGNGYNGRYRQGADVSATGLIAGDSDTAVELNGTNQRGEVVDAEWMDTLTGDVSVEAWCKPDAVDGIYDVVTRFYTTQAQPFILGINSNFRFLVVSNDTGSASAQWSSSPTIGNTYHIVGTYNSTTGATKLYVNGSLVATATLAGAGSLSIGEGRIGIGARITGATGGQFFDGVIDEVAIYDSELSSARVSAHYSAGTA